MSTALGSFGQTLLREQGFVFFPLRLRLSAGPSSWKGVQRVAEESAAEIERVYLGAARVGREAFVLDNVERELVQRDPRGAEAAVLEALTAMTRLIELRMPSVIAEVLSSGGEAAAKAARNAGGFRAAAVRPGFTNLRFDLVNPEALRWARERSSTLVRQITSSTRQAIRIAIGRSFAEGIPVREVGVILRESIGLDARRMQAVLNLRERIAARPGGKVWAGRTPIRVPDPVTSAFINGRTKAYAQRLLNQRAHSIARTEALAASNEGQRQLWTQAVEKDLLFADELRVWIVTGDRRLCPICAGSAGDLAPLDKPFPNGFMNPPAHPMCRCAQGISGKRGKKATKPLGTEVEPRSPLDKALAPSRGDVVFPSIPGGDILGDDVLAKQVLDTFPERIKALRRQGVQVSLRDSALGGRSGTPWIMDESFANGRARIATVDTALSSVEQAMARLRATGAVGRAEKMHLSFYEDSANEYAHATHRGFVEVNFNQPAWQSRAALEQATARDALAGFHPVSGSDSILVHEMGHIQHIRLAKATVRALRGQNVPVWLDDVAQGWNQREWESSIPRFHVESESFKALPESIRKALARSGWEADEHAALLAKEISREVSRYAQTNTAEFVAETYTGLVYGKRYGDDVMALYRALGGPEVRGVAVRALPQALPVAAPRPLPIPTGEKILKPIRATPEGVVGEEIRRIQALRAEGLDYTEIARRMGYDTTRRGKGWGKGPQKVFETIKRFGDPLGRVAPPPIGIGGITRPPAPAPAPVASGPALSWKANKLEKDAVEAWQANFYNVQRFRLMDAGKALPKGVDPAGDSRLSKLFGPLKSVLQNTKRFGGSTYRGVAEINVSTLKVGGRVEFNSMASSSKSRTIADQFASGLVRPLGKSATPVVFEFVGGAELKADLAGTIRYLFGREVVVQKSVWRIVSVTKKPSGISQTGFVWRVVLNVA